MSCRVNDKEFSPIIQLFFLLSFLRYVCASNHVLFVCVCDYINNSLSYMWCKYKFANTNNISRRRRRKIDKYRYMIIKLIFLTF